MLREKELVYFIYPSCDGNCEHCWSNDLMLGRCKPLDWHYRMIEKLVQMRPFSCIKLSGGEPFKNKDVGKIARRIHDVIDKELPIYIFTSGREFVSVKSGEEGILETKKNLDKYFSSYDNISIQLSVDEYHLKVLKRIYKACDNFEELTFHFIYNFIKACEMINKEHPSFLGPKLKIHCEEGHMEYHKKIFSWFPFDWWEKYVIITEGLVYSGNAKQLKNTFKIQESDMMSYFLLPGVAFYPNGRTKRAERFQAGLESVYLDDSENTAVLIGGWWNLINRKAEYTLINID